MILALKKSTLFLLINFVCQGVFCQTVLKGRIVDSKAEGIPFSHIVLEGTQLGTYSNNEGFFILNIPSSYSTEITTINITCIGYVPLLLDIHKNDLSHIRLDEDILKLSAVEVTPKNHAKDLVLNSISNIPNNYSDHTENYVGFVRETLFWESSGPRNPLYVAEAVIESSKDPYFKTSRNGHVKLIEGRKYVGRGLDALAERIIGGVHHAHRFDVIARKEEFVSNPDKFYYQLLDTIRLNSSNIYEVGFSDKDQSKSGSIFIEDSTFAISRVIFYYESGFPFRFQGIGRTYLKYEANYYRGYDDKWRLERTSYATGFKKGEGGLLNLVSEYATTEIKPFAEIHYIDRIQMGDVYLDKTGTYHPDFWKNYNIILPAHSSEYLFKNELNSSARNISSKITRRSIYNLLSKIKFGYGLSLQNMQIRDYNFSYSNSILEIQHAESSSEQLIWGLSSFFLYEFKPNTFIGLTTESPFTKTGITLYDLSILKDFNLNPNGRPIKISPGLRFGCQRLDHFIDNYTTEEEYKVNGKSFDSGSTDILLTQKQLHFQPNMMLSIEKSNRLSFYTSINYNLQFDRRIGLTFIEKDEFLFRKRQFLKNNKEGLTINSDGRDLLSSNINFNVGIFLTF